MRFRFGNVEIFPPSLAIDFMRWRKVSIGFSLIITIGAILVIAIKGVNYSIDYLGGAEITFRALDNSVTRDQLAASLKKAGLDHVEITSSGGVGSKKDSYIVRISREKNADMQQTTARADGAVKSVLNDLGKDKVEVGSVTNISGKIGQEEQMKGLMALLLSFIGILIYTAYRFDPRFAPGAVICLIHDVVVAFGFMTALGRSFSVSSIAAFLTIVGYSVNDTIIIYDRIRETMAADPRMPLVDVVNKSINQTMNRTFLTSVTGLVALLVLVVYGGGGLEDFALTMFIGILVGTYSSVYVAAPLTLAMDDFMRSRGWIKDGEKKQKVAKDPNYIPPVILKRRPENK